jgi:hypothetical protein
MEITMSNSSLSQLTRGIVAAIALSAASSGANAFYSDFPDPFTGQTVDLYLAASYGGLVPLPGVGPGGMTLYANHFYISGFGSPSTVGDHNTYHPTFDVDFLDGGGTPVGGGATLSAVNYEVQFVGRPSNTALGTFTMNILDATFSGVTSLGDAIVVSLANAPTATVSIAARAGGGFDIDYLTPLAIVGQYTLNGGAPIQTQTLGHGTVRVPEIDAMSGAGALSLLGFALALVGERRRRAA